MPLEAVLDRVIEDVADGNHVDWDVSESGALNEDERECLKWLKVLGDIAEVHRSTHESSDSPDDIHSAPAVAPRDIPAASALSTWGRYELLEKVGEGAFGSVYRAWDPKLEREVALKILHPHIADTGMTERLVREGRALARIRHSNVVSVFDVETHDGRVGLCMDFVRGQTLEGVLRTQGTLSAAEAALIGQDVCRALAAVHHAGLVHRDVKARNVMREQAGRIVLMDFGTGREARALQASQGRDIGGTPLYMAPEVLDGEAASVQSDIYSVGVLLYYLVSAGYPVNAPSVDALRVAHREGRRRFLSEVRPDLPVPFMRVVERSLAANRQDRFPNTGALLDALGAFVGESESTSRTLARRLLTTGVAAGSGMCVLMALGLLNTAAFNLTLGRGDFATDTVSDWWRWGLRASILPLSLLVLAAMLHWLCGSVIKTASRLSSTVAGAQAALAGRVGFWANRLLLDDAPVLASWVLMVSLVVLAAALWYFWPLISALSLEVSIAPSPGLAMLSPGLEPYHDSYRQIFSLLVLALAAAWYVVWNVGARHHQHAHRGMFAAGMVVIAVSLAFLNYPYRLLLKNEFEAVSWNGTECYMLGERSEDALLFCPGIEPPRNRVVSKTSGSLKRLGRIESIFTKFSPGAGGGAAGPDAARD